MRKSTIWVIAISTIILLPTWLTTAAFYFDPRPFFYRPWEYFQRVALKTSFFDMTWNQPRTGDLSRQYYNLRNQGWTVSVTLDKYGYRSVPTSSKLPAVLFVGDSYIAGSGLGDDQTVPWQFSKKLNLSVFNAAVREQRIGALLSDAQMRCVQLVIDARVDRAMADILPYLDGRMRRLRRFPNLFWIAEVDPDLYALHSLIGRYVRRHKNDWHAISHGTVAQIEAPQKHFIGDKTSKQDKGIAIVAHRHAGVKATGRNYIFLSLPDAGSVRVEKSWTIAEAAVRNSNQREKIEAYERRNSAQRVANELTARGINSLDLLTPFRKAYWSGNDPHFAHDTHWNAYGAKLTSDILVRLVKQKSLVSLTKYEQCLRSDKL